MLRLKPDRSYSEMIEDITDRHEMRRSMMDQNALRLGLKEICRTESTAGLKWTALF